jgi:hypothetical protein
MSTSRLDFEMINRAAFAQISTILAQLLPGGHEQGREYVARTPITGWVDATVALLPNHAHEVTYAPGWFVRIKHL